MRNVAKIVALALLAGVLIGPLGPARAAARPPSPPAPLAQGGKPIDQVAVVTMPGLDVQSLLAEDVQRDRDGLPPRFAQPIPVIIMPATAGDWETQADGSRLWRLRVSSPGAVSLNLGFTRYHMPSGGRLFLYTPDYRIVRGPFTAADNEAHGQLWSPILPGDEIVIEVSLPAAAVGELDLALTSVNSGYREFGIASSPDSGSCNLDVVCGAADGYSQVDAWRDQIRSVAVISTGGSTFCTGFLVNNTAQDLKGYFMTAKHCDVTAANAPSLVAYWNYENSWCRPVGSAESGGAGDGQLDQYNTGSIWRAGYSASDFTLVELDDPIGPDYGVYWAGWDATSADATSAVGIHHPNTDEKRISFEYDPTTTTSYSELAVPGDGTHVRITDWDLGTTEPGSSGSPLFNQDHRVVGQLHGGYAACGNDESDWYGRFSVSWDRGGSAPNNRLRDWLDPANTGQLVLDGRNQAPFTLAVAPQELSVCAPDSGLYTVTVGIADAGFAQPVELAAGGIPTGTVAAFAANPVVPAGTTTLSIDDTAGAAEGRYRLAVAGRSLAQSLTVTVGLNLYAGPPAAPALLSPADGAAGQLPAPTFTWQPGSLTDRYDWQLDAGPFFTLPLLSATDLRAPTYSLVEPLEGGRCYWWRARGDNPCGRGAWSDPSRFSTVVLSTSFYGDMESGAAQWTHAAAQGTDNWAIVAGEGHTPTHAWFAPDDTKITDTRLWTTVPLPVDTGATLSFWHKYAFEGAGYDGAVLEISTDGGSTWDDLGPYIAAPHGYNGTISSSFGNPLGGRSAWVGDLSAWTRVAVDLTAFTGQSAQFRWRIGCDSSLGDTGWYIDDVRLTTALPPGPAPALKGISPSAGHALVLTPVTIEGTGFLDAPNLSLGDTWLMSVTLASSTTVEAAVPAGMPAGVYTLTLYNGDCQEATLPNAFTVVDSLYTIYVPLISRAE